MKITYIFILLSIILATACSKDNFDTGIVGTVKYGEGDCMPIIDYSSREYVDFNGDVIFINKTDLDNLGNGDFEKLKENSISVSIKRGKINTELPVGVYMAMTKDLYTYTEENTIVIKSGEISDANILFWKCTSF